MSVFELNQRKKELQGAIVELCKKFGNETGFSVEHIRLTKERASTESADGVTDGVSWKYVV